MQNAGTHAATMGGLIFWGMVHSIHQTETSKQTSAIWRRVGAVMQSGAASSPAAVMANKTEVSVSRGQSQ